MAALKIFNSDAAFPEPTTTAARSGCTTNMALLGKEFSAGFTTIHHGQNNGLWYEDVIENVYDYA